MHDILTKLADNKEKLLFGFVVLMALLVALKAPWGGAGVSEINNNARSAAVSAYGDSGRAEQILKEVKTPEPPKSLPLDEKGIFRRFYDDRAKYAPPKSSAYVRGTESLERLAPISLSFPGFPTLPDYQLIAGPSPDATKSNTYVPRDNRPVELTRKETSEFPGGGGR
ncbi:hypothetical protein PLCT1_00286 [Planctomycetaceae bacterium]|nr:hypothetical protein PLCT1_00286 [Planctomycetaceae bacterium]